MDAVEAGLRIRRSSVRAFGREVSYTKGQDTTSLRAIIRDRVVESVSERGSQRVDRIRTAKALEEDLPEDFGEGDVLSHTDPVEGAKLDIVTEAIRDGLGAVILRLGSRAVKGLDG